MKQNEPTFVPPGIYPPCNFPWLFISIELELHNLKAWFHRRPIEGSDVAT